MKATYEYPDKGKCIVPEWLWTRYFGLIEIVDGIITLFLGGRYSPNLTYREAFRRAKARGGL